MRNLTVSIPDDVYRAARVRAAERGASISSVVAEHLREFAGREAEFRRLEAEQRAVEVEIQGFSAGDRLDRDAVHERAVR